MLLRPSLIHTCYAAYSSAYDVVAIEHSDVFWATAKRLLLTCEDAKALTGMWFSESAYSNSRLSGYSNWVPTLSEESRTSSRLTSSLRPDTRLKIKYSPGTHSTNSLTRSLAASRSATTSSQRTLPPGCLLKISNGGTIDRRLVAKPAKTPTTWVPSLFLSRCERVLASIDTRRRARTRNRVKQPLRIRRQSSHKMS